MVATINLTLANRDLVNYFTNWSANFGYNGNGEFSPSTSPYSQYSAGTGAAANTGVIMNGDFTYAPPGGFGGTVNNLQFGTDLNGTSASGWSLATAGLTVGLTGSDLSAASGFTEAVYSLTHGGSLTGVAHSSGRQFAGLYDYFGNVGTVQNGTASTDTLYSFDGNDTLNGGAGRDRFVFDRDIDGALSTTIGHDTVTGFTAGASGDFLRFALQDTAFDTFAEVYAASSQVGSDTVINLGSLGDITLANVTKTALVASNFEFVA
ncbi:hemolysin [Agrobacterium rosae]|uniref:hemolysin n=1 Tax=Agrobacterium rosae TaxID=1972867 RepID=UPI0019D3AB84|nr:hemolysin [Agrobacterium rosae]MBN7809279.1 hemolysin [Agrobacterium rosae]